MKKRLEDRLIELAFDERTESVPAEFAANPAAKTRLSEYQAMRTALGQLRELPEHQLSTERLREALLHQGLKRRVQFPWQVLGYGTTACALFFGALFVGRFMRTPHGDVKFVESPKPLALSQHVLPSLGHEMLPTRVDPTANKNLAMREGAGRVPLHTAFHSNSGHVATIAGEASLTKNLLTYVGLVPSGLKHPTVAPPNELDGDNQKKVIPPSGALADAVLPATREAMVVIHQNTDADTGLDTAEEQIGKTHVLVGG